MLQLLYAVPRAGKSDTETSLGPCAGRTGAFAAMVACLYVRAGALAAGFFTASTQPTLIGVAVAADILLLERATGVTVFTEASLPGRAPGSTAWLEVADAWGPFFLPPERPLERPAPAALRQRFSFFDKTVFHVRSELVGGNRTPAVHVAARLIAAEPLHSVRG